MMRKKVIVKVSDEFNGSEYIGYVLSKQPDGLEVKDMETSMVEIVPEQYILRGDNDDTE